MHNKSKFLFCIKILEERLIKEKDWLIVFKKHYDESPDWAESNIVSGEHRIKELEDGIEALKLNNNEI